MGARFNELDFGWDNEFSAITVDVPAFNIDSLPVTNGEFLEFVESGNYDESFWLPEIGSGSNLKTATSELLVEARRRVGLSGDVRSFAAVEGYELAGVR